MSFCIWLQVRCRPRRLFSGTHLWVGHQTDWVKTTSFNKFKILSLTELKLWKQIPSAHLSAVTISKRPLSDTSDNIKFNVTSLLKIFFVQDDFAFLLNFFPFIGNIFMWYYYWSLLYSAILCSQADSLHSHVILHEWIAFYSAFFFFFFLNIHRSGVLTALAWLVPQETAAILARSVYTIQPCTMSLRAKPHM